MNISYDSYKVFYHVARYQNITLAAKALYLTQPTVSHYILELEKELGCKLFTRFKKGVRLTREGSILYGHIAKAYAEIDRGETDLMAYLEQGQSVIKIGASETTMRGYLLSRLGRYKTKYPHTKFQVRNTTGKQVEAQLKEGSIDLAVMATPYPFHDISVTTLAEFSMAVIAGPSCKPFADSPMTLQQLSGFPLIALEQGTSGRYYMDTLFAAHGVPLRPDIELSTADLITPMAMQNIGIGFVARSFCQSALAKGNVVELTPAEELPVRSICLLTEPARELSLACKQFIQELTETQPPG